MSGFYLKRFKFNEVLQLDEHATLIHAQNIIIVRRVVLESQMNRQRLYAIRTDNIYRNKKTPEESHFLVDFQWKLLKFPTKMKMRQHAYFQKKRRRKCYPSNLNDKRFEELVFYQASHSISTHFIINIQSQIKHIYNSRLGFLFGKAQCYKR